MRSRLKTEESGFTLIEVLVSAMLVAAISIGVLAGIDSSSATSGQLRARGEASALAQSEQERLRALSTSALDAVALSSPPGGATTPQYTPAAPTIRGEQYTIKSWVWKVTQSGTPATSCTGATNTDHFLRIRTQVTWRNQPSGVPAARLESVVPLPPGGGGSLVATVKDAASPQTNFNGLSLSVDGGSASPTANGCVEWDNLTPGVHTVTFSRSPYTTPDGQQSVSKQVSVSDSSTAYATFTYAKGASFTLSFYYKTSSAGPVIPAPAGYGYDQVTATNANPLLTSPRVFGTSGTPVSSLPLSWLLGFPTSYTVFPGTCSGTDGASNTWGAPSFTLAWNSTTNLFAPSDTNGYRFPSYKQDWKYKYGTAATAVMAPVGGNLYFYRKADANCGAMTLGPYSLDVAGTATKSETTTFPVLPFGNYSGYCAEFYEDGSNGTATVGWWSKSVTTAPPGNAFQMLNGDLNTPQTLSTQTITANTGTPNGQCP